MSPRARDRSAIDGAQFDRSALFRAGLEASDDECATGEPDGSDAYRRTLMGRSVSHNGCLLDSAIPLDDVVDAIRTTRRAPNLFGEPLVPAQPAGPDDDAAHTASSTAAFAQAPKR